MDVTQPYQNAHYKAAFTACEGYLHAYIFGEAENLKSCLDVWGVVAERCRAGGYTRVLIEDDVDDELSVADLYEFSAKLPLLGFGALKVAVCDRHPHKQESDQFAEDVAVNRGVQGQVFFELEEAKAWLLDG